jgi:hypothetical protein
MTWITLHDAITAVLRHLLDVHGDAGDEYPAARGLDL